MWQLCKEHGEGSRRSCCHLEKWLVYCLTHHLHVDRRDPKGSPSLSSYLLWSKLPDRFSIHLLWATFSNTDPAFVYFALFISTYHHHHPKQCVLYFPFGIQGNWRLKEVLRSPWLISLHIIRGKLQHHFTLQLCKNIWAWKDQTIPDPITNLWGKIMFCLAAGY